MATITPTAFVIRRSGRIFWILTMDHGILFSTIIHNIRKYFSIFLVPVVDITYHLWYNTTMSDEEREYLNETIRNLNNQLVDALRERDEARREVCKRVESASCLSDGEPTTTASDYARWCGWDCYKEGR
jgi:hypothetical protein